MCENIHLGGKIFNSTFFMEKAMPVHPDEGFMKPERGAIVDFN
jgi:hypothetical protein